MNFTIEAKMLETLPLSILILDHNSNIIYSSSQLNSLALSKNIVMCDIIQSLRLMKNIKAQININGTNFSVIKAIFKKDSEQYETFFLKETAKHENILNELEETRELRDKFNAVIESSYDGIFVADENGKIIYVNYAYEKLTGTKREEILNKHVNELTTEGLLSHTVTEIVMSKKKTVTDIVKSKRTNIDLIVTGNPVFRKDGTIMSIIVNLRDITELVNLQRELQQTKVLSKKYYLELSRLRIAEREIISTHHNMQCAIEMALRVAQFDSTILIQGESGVGKELFAELIHNHGVRQGKPFVKINCGSIPENLLESELFGYERGAFSGAKKEGKPGLFEVAERGTLLLDEIGELPLNLQVKLLRVLQENEIRRVGGTKSIKINVRIIAITNKDLSKMVREKCFREDLYYRLNVVPINVPPLRDRKEDIPLLISYFLDKYKKKYNINKAIAAQAIDQLMDYNWPGNVRELENIIERLVVTTPDQLITLDDLPEHIMNEQGRDDEQINIAKIMPLKDAIVMLEKKLISRAIAKYKTKNKAATVLGVDRTTVLRKMNKYDIN